MTAGPVLYDVQGPRARRQTLILSVVVLAVFVAIGAWVVVRLIDAGTFAYDKVGPIYDPSNPVFSVLWQRIGHGLRMTLIAAAISIALSLVIGTATGVIRMLLGQWGRLPLVGVMEVLRGLPVVVAIYISYRTLPQLGVNVGVLPGPDGLWFLVIALTAYNSVIIAEILRAGVAALPSGQGEAAMAMGLSRIQTMWLILLPQAFRIMLPALISQLVVVLKDTSLAGFIGVYPELLYETKSIAADLQGFIAMYAVTGAIYITINMLLSYLAVVVQRGLARGNKAPQGADGDPEGPVQPPLADAVSGRGV